MNIVRIGSFVTRGAGVRARATRSVSDGRRVAGTIICSVVAFAAATRVDAQAAQNPVVAAERMAAQGDSAGAMRTLQDAVARDVRNASAWHKLGVLAWARVRSEGRKQVLSAEGLRLRTLADSGLRMATQLAPDSGVFWYDLAKYSLNTGNTMVRADSRNHIGNARKAAEAQKDGPLLSRILDEEGMDAWRSYHNVAHRALKGASFDYVPNTSNFKNSRPAGSGMPTELPPPSAVPLEVRRDKWAPFFRDMLQPLDPPSGIGDLNKAVEKFRAAVAADPANGLAIQHLFMSFVEKAQWKELHIAASDVIRRDSTFVEAWLARGLASLRLNDVTDAANAFTAANNRMTPVERQRFTDFRRMLPPHSTGRKSLFPDSVQYQQSTPELRQRWETLFWSLADPRASTPMNEARLEHFARIAHADLLWSSDDFDLRGSDSDRGDVFIRYGPPNLVANLVGETAGGTHVLIWVYNNDLAFVFAMTANYGTAFTALEDRVAVDSIREELPVSWANLKAVQRTVPMLSRAARFRATADSMDVIIAAAVPVRSLLEKSELGGDLPIDVQLDVHDPQAQVIGRQNQRAVVPGANLPVGIDAWWARRLGRGLNVVRVDAEQKDVERTAISTIEVPVDEAASSGMSDVLFVSSVAPSSAQVPMRWTDLQIKPVIGAFSTSTPVGLVWENYDLGNDNGNARYRVTVQLERTFTNNLRGWGARIIANVKNVAQGSASGTGALSLSFEETRPHGGAIVDFLSISLTQSVPGPYRVTITIADLVSGRTTRRTADFRLVQ